MRDIFTQHFYSAFTQLYCRDGDFEFMANSNSSGNSGKNTNSHRGQQRHGNSPRYSERYGANRPNPYTGFLPPGSAAPGQLYHPEAIDYGKRGAMGMEPVAEQVAPVVSQESVPTVPDTSVVNATEPPVASTAVPATKPSSGGKKKKKHKSPEQLERERLAKEEQQRHLDEIRRNAASETLAEVLSDTIASAAADSDNAAGDAAVDGEVDSQIRLSDDGRPMVAVPVTGNDGSTQTVWMPVELPPNMRAVDISAEKTVVGSDDVAADDPVAPDIFEAAQTDENPFDAHYSEADDSTVVRTTPIIAPVIAEAKDDTDPAEAVEENPVADEVEAAEDTPAEIIEPVEETAAVVEAVAETAEVPAEEPVEAAEGKEPAEQVEAESDDASAEEPVEEINEAPATAGEDVLEFEPNAVEERLEFESQDNAEGDASEEISDDAVEEPASDEAVNAADNASEETVEEEVEEEPKAPAPERLLQVAEADVKEYTPAVLQDDDDEVADDAGDGLFLKQKRPESSTTVFDLPEGVKLPAYIDDDDFLERWLDEEGDDMATTEKRKKRYVSAIIGSVTMIFALIGFIWVMKYTLGAISGLGNTDAAKDEYEEFISPVVMSEVVPFETWDTIPQDKLLQCSIFHTLTEMEADSYNTDDTNKLIIPSNDILDSAQTLFGKDVYMDVNSFNDMDNDDLYYSDTDDCFHVAATGITGPEPDVIAVSKRGNTITLTVGYIEETGVADSTDYFLTREFVLTVDGDSYYVSAIRDIEQED